VRNPRQSDSPAPPPGAPDPGKAARSKVRFRLVLAFPVLTTLLVLGLGAVLIDMQQRNLANPQIVRLTGPEIYARITQTTDAMTLVIIGAAAIAFVSGIVLALTVTNPIRRLARDTASIARGDLTRNISLNADGELAILGSALNEMVASINKYMLHSMSGGMLIIDESGVIVSLSGDAEFILGVSADQCAGAHITQVFPDIPENRRFLTIVNETLSHHRTFPTQQLAVSTEERREIPITLATSLLKDRDNTLVGLSLSFEDAKQLRRIEEQMRRVDRLTTLGGLAASVAHQVRNPLCSIKGLAQLLKENRADDKALCDYAGVIIKDAERIDMVVNRLMRMLQPTQTDWTLENLNDILGETVTLARHEIRDKSIEILELFDADLPPLVAQRENLMHAFLNFAVNAIQAIERQGTITVRTLPARAPMQSGRGPGGQLSGIIVDIEDNGPGMTEDELRSIFNPGYTSKEQGSGFGLAISQQTIQAHGGEIRVRSEPGVKTVFRIWLPLREPRADPAAHQGDALDTAGA
jgi:PAS domain S-box-containing protein